jgi:hypothetical protein
MAVEFPRLETLDGPFGLSIAGHLHEAEALAAFSAAAAHHLYALHRAELGEQLLQFGVPDLTGQISHKDPLAHDRAPC